MSNIDIISLIAKLFVEKMRFNDQKDAKRGKEPFFSPLYKVITFTELHHASHAWGSTHRHCGLLLGLVADEALGGEEHASDRGGSERI